MARLDAECLAAAYERDARRLLVYFTRRTYDAQLAVDLVGETYARAFESRRRYHGDPRDAGAVEAWVFGIARNVLHQALRDEAQHHAAIRGAELQEASRLNRGEIAQIEEFAGLGELRSELAAALQELSEEQRDAVRLRIVDELDYPDVAEALGISEQAARARVSRGLRALAAALDDLRPATEATS